MNFSAESLSEKPTSLSKNLIKHPYLILGLLCFCVTALTFGSVKGIFFNSVLFVAAIAVCTGVLFCISQFSNKYVVWLGSLVSFLVSCALVWSYAQTKDEYKTIYIVLIGMSIIAVSAVILYINGKLDTKSIVLLMLAAGFLLRVVYILYTDLTERQHDFGMFGYEHGHAAYIEYFMDNKQLPAFDVRYRWQFYHPPLFHIISAIWLSLIQSFGVGKELSWECVKIITLFCSSAVMLISYSIFKQLKIKHGGLVVAMALVCFNPTFIYFAGTVNNDIMSVAFMLGAILWVLRWYEKPTYKNIIPLALCIGFGMMTKLSVWMVTLSVALLFLVVLIKNIKSFKRFFFQYVVFGAICVPLALWWGIRNYILYEVPIAYIPLAGSTASKQYIGEGVHTITERLFDFNLSQFKSVYDSFVMFGGTYNEYNPTIGLLKTAVFGERINDRDFSQIKVFGEILFWSGVIIAVVSLVALVFSFVKKKPRKASIDCCECQDVDLWIKIALAVFELINLLSYYSFCIQYPHTCTQHIRYCMSLIVLGAVFIGMLYKDKKIAKSKLLIILTCIVAVFCTSSTYIYSVIS